MLANSFEMWFEFSASFGYAHLRITCKDPISRQDQ